MRPYFLESFLANRGISTPKAIVDTWRKVVMSLVRHPESTFAAEGFIKTILERCWHKDRIPQVRTSKAVCQSTLMLFWCLCDIAEKTGSRPLYNLLGDFFVRYGRLVASQEHPSKLFYWGAALCRVNLNPTEVVICMQKILAARPHFLDQGALNSHQHIPGSTRFCAALYNGRQRFDVPTIRHAVRFVGAPAAIVPFARPGITRAMSVDRLQTRWAPDAMQLQPRSPFLTRNEAHYFKQDVLRDVRITVQQTLQDMIPRQGPRGWRADEYDSDVASNFGEGPFPDIGSGYG
ncbi:hypothetical protein LTR28_004157 [Elasticomyces elasticus]|nr:hypothetical protein LTR28_004157 [Elasticomyces elasticus]